jgi:hypothetical protein
MKRQVLSWICGALLFWAAFDDVLAAQTPDLDDDIAAALDNDCLQDAPLNVLARREAQRIMRTCPPHSVSLGPRAGQARSSDPPSGSRRLADPLYLFMSLQC